MKNLSSQQWVIAASGALIVASVMLGHDNRLGYAMLVLAALCGIGTFVKAKKN